MSAPEAAATQNPLSHIDISKATFLPQATATSSGPGSTATTTTTTTLSLVDSVPPGISKAPEGKPPRYPSAQTGRSVVAYSTARRMKRGRWGRHVIFYIVAWGLLALWFYMCKKRAERERKAAIQRRGAVAAIHPLQPADVILIVRSEMEQRAGEEKKKKRPREDEEQEQEEGESIPEQEEPPKQNTHTEEAAGEKEQNEEEEAGEKEQNQKKQKKAAVGRKQKKQKRQKRQEEEEEQKGEEEKARLVYMLPTPPETFSDYRRFPPASGTQPRTRGQDEGGLPSEMPMPRWQYT